MKHEIRLPAVLIDRPWLVSKNSIGSLLDHAAVRGAAIARMDLPAIDAAVEAVQASMDRPLGRMVGSVAVIPVRGIITQKADFYSWWFGGTSVERLTASFRHYLNDPAVSTVIFDVDSPGGEVYGVMELADELFKARGKKKLVAVSNPFMASAAYWIGSSCDEVALMPSGQCGGVGCYMMHQEVSEMMARLGVGTTFVQYGDHKTEGNQFEPLSDEARAEFQAGVDFYGQLFDQAVARGRGVSMGDVKARFGQGRVLRAPDAKKVGMVDKVATLDQVLARFTPSRAGGLVAQSEAPSIIDQIHEHKTAAVADRLALATANDEAVNPNEDGICPDGYDKGEDGMCHVATKAAAADAQRQADLDALELARAVAEA